MGVKITTIFKYPFLNAKVVCVTIAIVNSKLTLSLVKNKQTTNKKPHKTKTNACHCKQVSTSMSIFRCYLLLYLDSAYGRRQAMFVFLNLGNSADVTISVFTHLLQTTWSKDS